MGIPTDRETAREVARYMLDPRRALTARRLKYFAGVPVIWAALRGLTQAGSALDDILYPEHRRQPIVAPTFIFAIARSGTTLLHRLMALDEERFVAPKLYQTLLPSVVGHRAIAALGALEGPVGDRLRALTEWINRTYLSGWEGIHDIRLDTPEEDEAPWLYTLVSPTLTLLFPDVDRFRRSQWLDRIDAPTRERQLDYYESVIGRLLYAQGPDRSYLNKNIMFAHRVRSVHDRFPDARFICLVRHPYDALGSFLRMWYLAWRAHSPDVGPNSEQARAMAKMAIDYYRYGLDCRRHVAESQFLVVRFDNLVADPVATIETIYDHFGMTMTDRYRARLREATARAGRFKSRGHQYSLEEFGLTELEVYRELRDVFDEFGFAP